MTAWRVRLYRIWYLPIISPAFLEAFYKIRLAFCTVIAKSRTRIVFKTHVHGVAASGLLAGVALGKSPVEGVGQGILAEVSEGVVLNLESIDVGWSMVSL